MPVAGRSTWHCGNRVCRVKLATVRGTHPARRLRLLTVAVYREDGIVEIQCPACGKAATRKISGGAGLVFKGSGFYITDYGKDGKGPRKDADKPAAKPDPMSGPKVEPGGGEAAKAPASLVKRDFDGKLERLDRRGDWRGNRWNGRQYQRQAAAGLLMQRPASCAGPWAAPLVGRSRQRLPGDRRVAARELVGQA